MVNVDFYTVCVAKFCGPSMLEKYQLIDLFDQLSTPRPGRELILRARVGAPVRDVQSRGGNVITLLSSQKMGCEIRTESRHIEFAAAVNHEYNPQVLEFYAQPCKLNLELIDDATGEIRNIVHFPDFLVVTQDGFTLEEWKSEQKLTRLAEKSPYRYVKGSDGHWYSPQIEKQLADFGIRYRIYSDLNLPRRRVENLLHLADYFHSAAEPCPPNELTRLQAALRQHGVLCIAELLEKPFSFDIDMVLKAVADQEVVADLNRELLTEPRRSHLYRDPTMRDFMAAQVPTSRGISGQEKFVLDIAVGARFAYETQELTISLVSEKELVCTQRDGKVVNLTKDWLVNAFESGRISPIAPESAPNLDLSRYSDAAIKEALKRQAILGAATIPIEVSDRTTRRWLARQRVALLTGANEVLALAPHTAARGNHSQRLSDQQEVLLQEIIDTKWRSHEAKNYKNCHRELRVACDAAGIKAPSYPTLIDRIKSQQTNNDVRVRHGKRMAYQQSEFVDVLYFDTPIHGSRPFQYVHIDHTLADVELVCSDTGKGLGKPWLTIAIDEFSRRIVGLYLSYDPPSYHSVMMVIRDIVRRHQRLPEFIVVDNGSDFASQAFETFLQVMGVHVRFRPAGRPRHGAVMERIFGRVNTEYIHNLAGNTKAMKNVRMTTGKHQPKNFAVWTLAALYYGLEHWAFDYYEQERHPALHCSPREAFQKGLRDSGARPQRNILLNKDFLIATCPPAERGGVRLVNRQTGVKVNNLHYWSPEFRDHRIAGNSFQVRYDPWDASSIYVRLKDRWVQATCRTLVGLGQLTCDDRKALSDEYIRRRGELGDDAQSSQRLAEFMRVLKPEGALEAAFARQSENKALYNHLQLSNISPIAGPRKICLIEEVPQVSAPVAEDRPYPSHSSDTPAETRAEDQLPDFDVF